jgi:hypothetical protein
LDRVFGEVWRKVLVNLNVVFWSQVFYTPSLGIERTAIGAEVTVVCDFDVLSKGYPVEPAGCFGLQNPNDRDEHVS